MKIIIISVLFSIATGCPKDGESLNDGTCYYLRNSCPKNIDREYVIQHDVEFSIISELKERKIGRDRLCMTVYDTHLEHLTRQRAPEYLRRLNSREEALFDKKIKPNDSLYFAMKVKNKTKNGTIVIRNSKERNGGYLVKIELLTQAKSIILSTRYQDIGDTKNNPFNPTLHSYYEFELSFGDDLFDVVDILENRRIGRLKPESKIADMISIDNIEISQIEHVPRGCSIQGGTYRFTEIVDAITSEDVFEKEIIDKLSLYKETEQNPPNEAKVDMGPTFMKYCFSDYMNPDNTLVNISYIKKTCSRTDAQNLCRSRFLKTAERSSISSDESMENEIQEMFIETNDHGAILAANRKIVNWLAFLMIAGFIISIINTWLEKIYSSIFSK